ncbi:sigma-70 family RNA polymerase sigma factor [Actinomadura parmotrematis]|uniref:sigma-70 family RNA polymerase sigma factor n=1 Tax=Actinomadura parmotrematis TaxID=2864039 RepID=UPI00215D9816|nr:sigma-70 family RNA polymerase sigma factor [Actinomadura parmotrematis]
MSNATPPAGPAPAEPSDAALIALIRDGDAGAYGPLYERHLAAARGLARHLVGGDAAEDAVQETFTKILDVLRRGGGPRAGFRPYLLTSVRNTVYDRYRGDKRVQATDRTELLDQGVPFDDPALAGLERSLIVRAFRSLPERWQAVLWHTEIEGAKAAEVAPLLGLTANGVAALAYRAREGLRQAYLQMHLAEPDAPLVRAEGVPAGTEECRPALDKLGAYVRGGLAKRDARAVEAHLDECARCAAIHAEIADVNGTLREGVGPFVLGAAGVLYLAAAGHGGGAAVGAKLLAWFRHLPKRQQQVLSGTTGAAAVAAAAAAMLLVSGTSPVQRPAPRPQPNPPAAVAPAKPDPKPRAPRAAPAPPPAAAPKPVAKPVAKAAPEPPAPSPSASASTPAPPPDLTARIGAVGTLLRGRDGIVAMSVANAGKAPSKDVVADVTLPPDVAYAGGATGREAARFTPAREPGDGWSCRPSGPRTVRCTHAPLPARATASAYLGVQVGAAAPYGTPPTVTLRGGRGLRTATADAGVAADGMRARFAADGHVRTVQTGNALLGCDPEEDGCRAAMARKGDRRDDDFFDMRPVDRDADPATSSSSAARLDVPAGGRVLWAGLYWSGVAGDAARRDGASAKLRAPGGSYTTVRAAEVRRGRLPDFTVYQAFADVTALVRAGGGGTWWGADVPTVAGAAHYAGWALVAVVEDPAGPYRQAMVLDDARALGPDGPRRLEVSLNGLVAGAGTARIGLVAWEGDAGLAGDRLAVGGAALTPQSGDQLNDNILDSSAAGAIDANLTFGIDVDYFAVALGRRPAVTLSTGQDAFLTGVVTVTAPMRS